MDKRKDSWLLQFDDIPSLSNEPNDWFLVLIHVPSLTRSWCDEREKLNYSAKKENVFLRMCLQRKNAFRRHFQFRLIYVAAYHAFHPFLSVSLTMCALFCSLKLYLLLFTPKNISTSKFYWVNKKCRKVFLSPHIHFNLFQSSSEIFHQIPF